MSASKAHSLQPGHVPSETMCLLNRKSQPTRPARVIARAQLQSRHPPGAWPVRTASTDLEQDSWNLVGWWRMSCAAHRDERSHDAPCPRQDWDDQPPVSWVGHGDGWRSLSSHQWSVHASCCHAEEAASLCAETGCPLGRPGGREAPRALCRSERRPASAGHLACHLASSSGGTVGFERTSSSPRSTVDSGGASSP